MDIVHRIWSGRLGHCRRLNTKKLRIQLRSAAKQIEALKQQGGKVSTQAEKEMNQLLVQMNHEHSEIKRALELKNQQVTQKVAAAKKTFGEDWPGRVQRALGEFSEGLERAWDQLQGAQ